MTEITDDTTKKGKSVEYRIASELLRYGFDVYVPLADVEGIDMIIKGKNSYVELQIKSRIIKNDEDYFSIPNFEDKPNFFIICHEITSNNFYAMPSIIFKRHCKEKTEQGRKKMFMTYKEIKFYGNSYANDDGIKILKKAIENPENTLKKAK